MNPSASRFKTHSIGLGSKVFNPLEWVWDLIAAGEAIGNLEYGSYAKI